MGELDELTAALQDDEKRRRLEAQAGGLAAVAANSLREALARAAAASQRPALIRRV